MWALARVATTSAIAASILQKTRRFDALPDPFAEGDEADESDDAEQTSPSTSRCCLAGADGGGA